MACFWVRPDNSKVEAATAKVRKQIANLALATNGDYSGLKHGGSLPPRAMPDVLNNGASYISYRKCCIYKQLITKVIMVFSEVAFPANRPFYFELHPLVRPSKTPFLSGGGFLSFRRFCPWRLKIVRINSLVQESKSKCLTPNHKVATLANPNRSL